MEIRFNDNEIPGFNEKAREEITSEANKLLTDLLREVYRIEERSSHSDHPEITSKEVKQAMQSLKSGSIQQKTPKPLVLNKVISTVSPVLLGVLFDSEKMYDPVWGLSYLALFAITLVSLTVTVYTDLN